MIKTLTRVCEAKPILLPIKETALKEKTMAMLTIKNCLKYLFIIYLSLSISKK